MQMIDFDRVKVAKADVSRLVGRVVGNLEVIEQAYFRSWFPGR